MHGFVNTVDREIFAVKNFRRRPLPTKIKHAKYCMHSKYVYRPIPNISPATKIRLREHFTAEIFYRRKYPELRYACQSLANIVLIVVKDSEPSVRHYSALAMLRTS